MKKRIVTVLSIISICILVILLCISNNIKLPESNDNLLENQRVSELNSEQSVNDSEDLKYHDTLDRGFSEILKVATGIAWVLSILGALYLLKMIVLPFFSSLIIRTIEYLGHRKNKKKLFRICLLMFCFGIILTLSIELFESIHVGIADIDKDDYINDVGYYVVGDNNKTEIIGYYTYQIYLFFKLVYLIFSFPIIISGCYLFLRHLFPFIYSLKRF